MGVVGHSFGVLAGNPHWRARAGGSRGQPGYDQEHNASNLIVVDGLGTGGYATVLKAENKITKEKFALKVMFKAKMATSRDRKRVLGELKVLAELSTVKSPFLMASRGAFETVNEVYIILDSIDGGDLFFHLVQCVNKTGGGFKEDEARVLLAELTLAVQHMHSAGFLHRDIKVCYSHYGFPPRL